MEYNEIKRLLDRYFDGETTLDEEQALRRYFASTADIPADLRYAAPMFAYVSQKRAQTRPAAARTALKCSSRRRFSVFAAATAAAACIALGAVAVFHSGDFSQNPISEVAYCYLDGRAITDRAEAEKLTRRILGGVQADIEHSSEMLAALSIFTK